MNSIIFRYLLSGYFKDILKVILFFYCFGLILNLFEEVEFFKNVDAPFYTPIILTSLFIPGMLIKLLPFIIFISSMKFIIDIRNNKDLLTMKIFGYSNFKIFLILASTSFIVGWLTLLLFNPVTSTMAKYYEKTKSNYSLDIDHLVTFNKNGLWIKENLNEGQRIISASNDLEKKLKDITIFNFDENYVLKEKIYSKSANIENNNWKLDDVSILKIDNNISEEIEVKSLTIESIYTYDKITNLFKNLETLSFVELVTNYQKLINRGYNEVFLKQSLHSMLSMPFFLFIMTALASILIMNTLKKSNNFRFIILGLITCALIYYLKDLSIALGQTNRIPLTLANWIPVIVIGIFSFVGILQINEK
mgnify:CR=1 FL=1